MSKFVLALSCAIAALTVTAAAQERRVVRLAGPDAAIDADNDGWVTRAEAAAAADRMFARIDADGDGRLTDDDHHAGDPDISDAPDVLVEDLGDGQRRVMIRRAPSAPAGAAAPGAPHVERDVVVIHRAPGAPAGEAPPHAPAPPHPPHPPHAPTALMLFAHGGEADLNGDGALSADEFRAQQLRYFDAADANGDGRIRARPPRAAAPAAPTPPTPPRRR